MEKLLGVLAGVLDFSFSHAGPSLDCVCMEVSVLELAGSGCGVSLAPLFWGKIRRVVLEGDSNLMDRRWKLQSGNATTRE